MTIGIGTLPLPSPFRERPADSNSSSRDDEGEEFRIPLLPAGFFPSPPIPSGNPYETTGHRGRTTFLKNKELVDPTAAANTQNLSIRRKKSAGLAADLAKTVNLVMTSTATAHRLHPLLGDDLDNWLSADYQNQWLQIENPPGHPEIFENNCLKAHTKHCAAPVPPAAQDLEFDDQDEDELDGTVSESDDDD